MDRLIDDYMNRVVIVGKKLYSLGKVENPIQTTCRPTRR